MLLGIPGSPGSLKATLLIVEKELDKQDCLIISSKYICPLNLRPVFSSRSKFAIDCVYTGLSSIEEGLSLWAPNGHWIHILGFISKSIWMGKASRNKENKNRKQKMALTEIRSPNTYRPMLVPTVSHQSFPQIVIPHFRGTAPIPVSSGMCGTPSRSQYLYGDGEGSGNHLSVGNLRGGTSLWISLIV